MNLKRRNPFPLDSTCRSPLVLQSCLKYRAKAGSNGLSPTKYPMSTRSQCAAALAISSSGQTAILTPFLSTGLMKLRARGDHALSLEQEHLSAQEAAFSATGAVTKGLHPRERDRRALVPGRQELERRDPNPCPPHPRPTIPPRTPPRDGKWLSFTGGGGWGAPSRSLSTSWRFLGRKSPSVWSEEEDELA